MLFTCGLTSAGAAYCWGDNTYGELGNSSTTQSNAPVAVTTTGTPLSGLTLTQVSAGDVTACALSSTVAAYCWGNGAIGQLGNGSTTAAQTTAVAVTTAGTPISGVTLTQVNVGNFFTCGLGSAGAAYCWGIGNNGDLGITRPPGASCRWRCPRPGCCLGDPDPGQSRHRGQVRVCSGHLRHRLLLGTNSSGQVGNPDTAVDFLVPATVARTQATMIAAGNIHSCEITSGKAYCWVTTAPASSATTASYQAACR